MIYNARVFGGDTKITIDAKGFTAGDKFIDYADVISLTPMNHRVLADTATYGQIEISMLGFSYDGFWKELTDCFSNRSLEALFAEGSPLMFVEGEYQLPEEKGRANIALYSDSVCILPQTRNAVRIPLCFTSGIQQEGYMIRFTLKTGETYTVGKMGYDTLPFAERAVQAAQKTKKERERLIKTHAPQPPFTDTGLFRTTQADWYWAAAFAQGRCALELFTNEDSATYLYRFSEPKEQFFALLEYAMEAMGIYREIIWQTDEQLSQNSLYRMAVQRCKAVGFLRERFDGRLIHSESHGKKLEEFLR